MRPGAEAKRPVSGSRTGKGEVRSVSPERACQPKAGAEGLRELNLGENSEQIEVARRLSVNPVFDFTSRCLAVPLFFFQQINPQLSPRFQAT